MGIVGMGPQLPGPGYRVRNGDILICQLWAALVNGNNASTTFSSKARIVHDDGTEQQIDFTSTALAGVASGNTGQNVVGSTIVAADGWIVEWGCNISGSFPNNSVWVTYQVATDALGNGTYQICGKGPIGVIGAGPTLGEFIEDDPAYWPVWVFQGTVAEDATVGTHVCTLTVSPGPSGLMILNYAQIIATGAAGLVQNAYIDDGAGHVLTNLFAATAAGTYSFPGAIAAAAGASAGAPLRLSGAMRLILTATTSTVSDTQTFAVMGQISPKSIPSATLADNTGTPTLTTNVNKVF